MDNFNSKGEFACACANHGFARNGKVFSRCIGDGIYQSICITSQEHPNPVPFECTSANKKALMVKIGIWSMYSNLPAFYFEDRKNLGDFYPENLLGMRLETSSFMGFQNECEIMLSTGLSYLDSITTQKKLLSAVRTLQQVQYGAILPHRLELCAPYLLCGEYENALSILYGIYAQNWLNFHARYDYLKESGQYEAYIIQENNFENDINEIAVFLQRVLGRQRDRLKESFLSCLNRNVQLAKENKIPFTKNFLPECKA